MTFDEWLKDGYDRGYRSPPVCVYHDGIPTTATEDEEMFEDMDGWLWILPPLLRQRTY